MFTRTIKDIQSTTEFALNRSIEYRSITAPAHFVKQSSMGTLMLAAYNLHFFASGQSYQIIPLANAARLAYDLDSCKGFEQPPGCDVDDEDYFALVLEYSRHYLVLHFLNIGHYICIPIESKRLPSNGEDANRRVRLLYSQNKQGCDILTLSSISLITIPRTSLT